MSTPVFTMPEMHPGNMTLSLPTDSRPVKSSHPPNALEAVCACVIAISNLDHMSTLHTSGKPTTKLQVPSNAPIMRIPIVFEDTEHEEND